VSVMESGCMATVAGGPLGNGGEIEIGEGALKDA
jgi:hypothetical protein